MKLKSITIIGNYGIENRLNGQTARTRTIYQTIKEKYNKYNIIKIDTANINLFALLKTIIAIVISTRVVIMPAQKALKPILKLIKLLHSRK